MVASQVVVSGFRGNISAVEQALSLPRFQTYLAARHGVYEDAMDLYEWNAKISNALFFPMHVCEVAIRNAVSEAIGKVHGPNWPYSRAFQQTLPDLRGPTFNPRNELKKIATKHPGAPGKVIADLKFIFWETMFTQRFCTQIWHKSIHNVLPYASANIPAATPVMLVSHVHTRLGKIRGIRNRIAHHEPIFSENLSQILDASKELVHLRCKSTHAWLQQSESVSLYLSNPA